MATSATPTRYAEQSYAPDAVATVRVNGTSRPVNATSTTQKHRRDAGTARAADQEGRQATPLAQAPGRVGRVWNDGHGGEGPGAL
jgi:hypothetical protein